MNHQGARGQFEKNTARNLAKMAKFTYMYVFTYILYAQRRSAFSYLSHIFEQPPESSVIPSSANKTLAEYFYSLPRSSDVKFANFHSCE